MEYLFEATNLSDDDSDELPPVGIATVEKLPDDRIYYNLLIGRIVERMHAPLLERAIRFGVINKRDISGLSFLKPTGSPKYSLPFGMYTMRAWVDKPTNKQERENITGACSATIRPNTRRKSRTQALEILQLGTCGLILSLQNPEIFDRIINQNVGQTKRQPISLTPNDIQKFRENGSLRV